MQLGSAGRAVEVEVIQEHEGLQHLAEIAGAHQPRDRTVAISSGTADDPSLRHPASPLGPYRDRRRRDNPLFDLSEHVVNPQ
jgi:hypothetical protein